MNRQEAWDLLCEYTQSESLRKHALSVEAAMIKYAEHFGQDRDRWSVTGLLHDFDYERWPNPPDHTREGAKILRDRGLDAEIVEAILSHADWNQDDYPRDRPIRKALFPSSSGPRPRAPAPARRKPGTPPCRRHGIPAPGAATGRSPI